MKSHQNLVLGSAAVLGLVFACSQAEFGGSNGSASSASKTDAASASPSAPASTAAPTQAPATDANSSGGPNTTPCAADSVSLTYTSAQQDCIVNQGKTWDFENNQCGNMPPAKFTCNWANVVSQLQTLGLLNSTIQTASTNGSKLVTCGQSADSNSIAIQFVGPSSNPPACSGTPSTSVSITSGCYVHNPNGAAPTIPSYPSAAYDAYVYNCMNTL